MSQCVIDLGDKCPLGEGDYQTKYQNVCKEKITRTVNINSELKVNGSRCIMEKMSPGSHTVKIPPSKTCTTRTNSDSLGVSLIENDSLTRVLREGAILEMVSWVITECCTCSACHGTFLSLSLLASFLRLHANGHCCAVQARLCCKCCRHVIGLGSYHLSMTSLPFALVAVWGCPYHDKLLFCHLSHCLLHASYTLSLTLVPHPDSVTSGLTSWLHHLNSTTISHQPTAAPLTSLSFYLLNSKAPVLIEESQLPGTNISLSGPSVIPFILH